MANLKDETSNIDPRRAEIKVTSPCLLSKQVSPLYFVHRTSQWFHFYVPADVCSSFPIFRKERKRMILQPQTNRGVIASKVHELYDVIVAVSFQQFHFAQFTTKIGTETRIAIMKRYQVSRYSYWTWKQITHSCALRVCVSKIMLPSQEGKQKFKIMLL